MLLPATKETLLEDPFKLKFVAAAVVAPWIVTDDAPVLRLILLPATNTMLPVLSAPAVPSAETTLGP